MDLSITSIIVTIIAGAIIGALARFVLPGRQNISMAVTVILGILGSFAGAFIWDLIDKDGATKGIDWIAFLIGIAVAAVLILIYGMVTGKDDTARRLR